MAHALRLSQPFFQLSLCCFTTCLQSCSLLEVQWGESWCLFPSLQWWSPGYFTPWSSCSISVYLWSHFPKHSTTFKGWSAYIYMKTSLKSPGCLSQAPPPHKQLCLAYSMDTPFKAPVKCQAWCQALIQSDNKGARGTLFTGELRLQWGLQQMTPGTPDRTPRVCPPLGGFCRGDI